MVDKAISERQQYWLTHVRAADGGDQSTVAYARAHDLKVKHLYQWKSKLNKLGFYDLPAPVSSFVSVKTVKASNSPGACGCTVVLANGVRLAFQGELSAGVIRELMLCAGEIS